MEALGRINAPESITALKRIVESKKMFGWTEPQELRIAALQALEKLDPAWAIAFLPKSGLDKADLTLAPLEVDVQLQVRPPAPPQARAPATSRSLPSAPI